MVKRVGGGLGADDGVHHWDGAEAMSGEIMAQGNADACGVWEGKRGKQGEDAEFAAI